MRQKIKITLLALCVIIIVLLPQPFPAHLLKADFQIYWSASYLLKEGENFSDSVRLLEVQQQLSGWDDTENVLVTWNPPWFLAWLIPFTLLEFDRASWIWFLINLSLLFASTTLLWLLSAQSPRGQRKSWIGIVIAILFMPTLTTLLVGQITTLVLFGLIGFLYFNKQGSYLYAGLLLSLTSIKPHLVYVILPIILLDALIRTRWRIIIGFLIPIGIGTAIALFLRPTFMVEYFLLMNSGRVLKYAPPTLSVALSSWLNLPWIQLMGLIILPLCLLVWWFQWRDKNISWLNLMSVAVFISVITAPYGWSFDVIILLIPILQCLIWIMEKQIPFISTLLIGLAYILSNSILFYQRSIGLSEEAYFWFPLVLLGLYVWCWNVRSIPSDIMGHEPKLVA